MRLRMIVVTCAIVASGTVALAAVPTSITVQGKLTDTVGVPLSAGDKSFVFRIFNASSGGSQMWPLPGPDGELQTIRTDANGLWIGLIGIINPLNAATFFDQDSWLEITVEGATLPRTRMVTVPHAFRVSTVDGAEGGTITSKVSIGPAHTNTGINAFIAGEDNVATGDRSTVTGGDHNSASATNATIGGGRFNQADGQHSTVSGGNSNAASGLSATVGGGGFNYARGQHSTVSGGGSAADSDSNSAGGDWSTVGGGRHNTATEPYSTIAGGGFNYARGDNAAVGGGSNNFADADFSSVAGGFFNLATQDAAAVGGGQSNRATGRHSTVPGGHSNTAAGDYSFAAGRHAKSNHTGTFVWGDSTDSDFSSTGANQFLIRASGGVGVGTNAPEAPLHVSEGSAGAVTAYVNAVAAFERNGNAYLHLLSPDANENGLLFGTPSAGLGGAVLFNSAAVPNGLEFRTNSNDFAVAINDTGHVGINTTAPYTSLSVAGTIGFKNGAQSEIYMFETGTSNADRMILAHSPSVLDYGLEYQDVGDKFAFVGNGLPVMTVDLSGTGGFVGFGSIVSPSNIITIPNSNNTSGRALGFAWDTYSSRRWKTDIETMRDALAKVNRLRGVTYKDKSQGKSCIGLIAEEVGEVIPEVVQYEPNGVDAKSVDYARLVALLIEGMKEQQRQIDELKSTIKSMTP